MTIEKLTKKSTITTRALENNLPLKYPHPTSHYQPLTTKAFMKIDWFANKVAISMTLVKICPTRISEIICFYIPSMLLSRLERQKIKAIDLLGLLL